MQKGAKSCKKLQKDAKILQSCKNLQRLLNSAKICKQLQKCEKKDRTPSADFQVNSIGHSKGQVILRVPSMKFHYRTISNYSSQ